MKHIDFAYEKNSVLEDITFTLKQGDFLDLIYGSGK